MDKTSYGRHENSTIKKSDKMSITINPRISRNQTQNVIVNFENFVSEPVLQIGNRSYRW
jgi:hypothetical protein